MNPRSRICPSCVRVSRRKHTCHRCGYTADTGLPTTEDIRTGRDIGADWNDVDIGGIARLAIRLNTINPPPGSGRAAPSPRHRPHVGAGEPL